MAGNSNSGRGSVTKSQILVASLAREHTEKAIKTLVHLMDTAEENAVRKAAADSLLDRGWGKPAQAVHDLTDKEARTVFGWEPTQN